MQENPQQPFGERLLRLPAVIDKCGIAKSAVYAGMKAGTFPKCIKLGPRASAWPLSSIENWIAEKISESKARR